MKLCQELEAQGGLKVQRQICAGFNELDEPRTLCNRAAGRTNAFEESVPLGGRSSQHRQDQKVL